MKEMYQHPCLCFVSTTQIQGFELQQPVDATVVVLETAQNTSKRGSTSLLGAGKCLFGVLRLGKLAKSSKNAAGRLLRVGKQTM